MADSRTPHQLDIALHWADGAATVTRGELACDRQLASSHQPSCPHSASTRDHDEVVSPLGVIVMCSEILTQELLWGR